MVSATHALKVLGTTKRLISAINVVKEPNIMPKLINVKSQLPQQFVREELTITNS